MTADVFEQFALRLGVTLPQLFVTQHGIGTHEPFRLQAPAREIRIVETGNRRRCPGVRVYAVRNCRDAVSGEHASRCLDVALGNAIDVLTQIQCQACVVELVRAGEVLHRLQIDEIVEKALYELV